MIWAAMLLSISGYSWYLAFAFNLSASYTGFWAGLAGLFFICILPTFLGFTTNRSLLVSGPTVLKIIRVNFVRYLIYAGLTVLSSIFISRLFLISVKPLDWKTCLFISFWQLLSWLCGTYFVLNSPQTAAASSTANVRALEISLIMFIPAIFLLTFMGLPSLLLITVIACWFMTLALTLALEGIGFTETSIFRYDIVLFHAFIPVLAAIILFLTIFSGEVQILLQAAQKAFFAILSFILHLLELLFSKGLDSYYQNPGTPAVPIIPEGSEMARNPSLLFILPFLILTLLLLITSAVAGLIKLLKTRVVPVPALPGRPRSFTKAVMQVLKWLVMLVRNLFKKSIDLVIWVKAVAGKLKQKFKNMLSRWLPAKTPYQKILRSYEALLRLGRKWGCPRKLYETPLEYAERLQKSAGKRQLPCEEISRLTGLFLEAHYSNRPVNWHQAAESQALLKIIKA